MNFFHPHFQPIGREGTDSYDVECFSFFSVPDGDGEQTSILWTVEAATGILLEVACHNDIKDTADYTFSIKLVSGMDMEVSNFTYVPIWWTFVLMGLVGTISAIIRRVEY